MKSAALVPVTVKAAIVAELAALGFVIVTVTGADVTEGLETGKAIDGRSTVSPTSWPTRSVRLVVVPAFPSGSVTVMLLALPATAPVKPATAVALPRKPAGAAGSLRKVLMEPGTPPPSAARKLGGIAPGAGRSCVIEHLVPPALFTHFAKLKGNVVTPQGFVRVKFPAVGGGVPAGYVKTRRWRWKGAPKAFAGLGGAPMSAPVVASMKVYSMPITTSAPTGDGARVKIATASE
jgi:hypothetical protein